MKNNTPSSLDVDLIADLAGQIFGDEPPKPTGLASDVTDDQALTPADDAPPQIKDLRQSQRTAIQLIMAGKGYTHAAAAANVTRKTIYNWVHYDEAFKAALAAWRRRLDQHAEHELTAATAAAARTFSRTAATDWRAAAMLLRHRGLLSANAAASSSQKLAAALESLPPKRRGEIEKQIQAMIAGKEPEYMPEVRALQERMKAEEASAALDKASVESPDKGASA